MEDEDEDALERVERREDVGSEDGVVADVHQPKGPREAEHEDLGDGCLQQQTAQQCGGRDVTWRAERKSASPVRVGPGGGRGSRLEGHRAAQPVLADCDDGDEQEDEVGLKCVRSCCCEYCCSDVGYRQNDDDRRDEAEHKVVVRAQPAVVARAVVSPADRG